MYEKEKQQIINCALKLDKYGLIALSGGNVSQRMPDGNILITPSGMIYGDMVAEDVLLVDESGTVQEGTRKVSVDTIALCYIYRHMPKVNAVIHTHQPFATGLGLVSNQIDCDLTTIANAVKGDVPVAPYSSAASEDMGVKVVDYIGNKLAVVLKNHGVVSVGKDLKEALYAAVYLEEGAKTQYIAQTAGGKISKLTPEQVQDAVKIFESYGQPKDEGMQ
ncbi:MAG: class II aldolase/adducin family protein [Enterococcaceae bacterium]|jgi:L-ribulose-5-phosphate 4-epimerase|nr:class II aldolase/adducin family protein [Enterococcaceae bacterium]MCI1919302.1 class II aldolase/adducin family protein [Enterococcaceae bacterium]